MKSVLMSIQPKWCELIANGQKTIEVRKTRPKIDTPFKVYIYCTQTKTNGDFILCKSVENAKLFGFNNAKGINKGFAKKEDVQLKGKVIGEFVCDRISVIDAKKLHDYCLGCEASFVDGFAPCDYSLEKLKEIGLSSYELSLYIGDKNGYEWHISDLLIYDEPKELGDFCKFGVCPCDAESVLHCTKNMSFCAKRNLKRPPQSWCYVEGGEQ